MKLSQLAERQILKAQAEGQMDNLKGAGKAIPKQSGDSSANVGFRIMAEAGVVPREIQLTKAVDAQRLVLQATTEAAARKREMAILADLELRLAIEQEARRKYYSTA